MNDNTEVVKKTKDDLQQDSIDFIYRILGMIKTLFWVCLFFIAFFFVYMGFLVK